METSILTVLQFSIKTLSPYTFLKSFAKVTNADKQLWNLARSLLELTLIDLNMLAYKPSLLAASSIFLADKIINGEQAVWT